MKLGFVFVVSLFCSFQIAANPYPIRERVSQDADWMPTPRNTFRKLNTERFSSPPLQTWTRQINQGYPVLRVQVGWRPDETYHIDELVKENSGTPNLLKASQKNDPLGSYRGALFDLETERILALQTIGTGKEYRKLSRAMTFRFPLPQKKVGFVMQAEHPVTGKMETVIKTVLDPQVAQAVPVQPVEVRTIKTSTRSQKLYFNIYSDYFGAEQKEEFFKASQSTVAVLQQYKFPGLDALEIRAVFSPSQLNRIGMPKDLGQPIPKLDSFLGLYFPYWHNFGRWYHVVYPTYEKEFRNGLGQVDYDFALALINDSGYWGVGNFRELTAVPAYSSYFGYLLIHELGHYFGLNEEYNGGGPTELEFAPEIHEPWSQNITFLRSPSELKWKRYVEPGTPIPTPGNKAPKIGAYKGGYADSPPRGMSHLPRPGCVMNSSGNFCEICHHAILERIKYELGNY